jgi:hypothetical protein
VDWSISNDTGGKIKVEEVHINWPEENGVLNKIKLDESQIWSGEVYSPTKITSGMTGDRQISSGGSRRMRFFFGSDAYSSGYTLEIVFNNDCSPSQSR